MPAVHRSCTKPLPILYTRMSRCSSNIILLIAVGTGRPLSDALLSNRLLSCVKTTPTRFTHRQMVSVVDTVVTDLATDIDLPMLIGNVRLLMNNVLHIIHSVHCPYVSVYLHV